MEPINDVMENMDGEIVNDTSPPINSGGGKSAQI